jgi:hypothetical protein
MPRPNLFRRLAVAALASVILPLVAWAEATYDVEVQPTLGGLPIRIETVAMPAMLVVRLTNDGTAKVRCDLRYDASPQAIRRSYVYVEPGETAENSFQAKRRWSNVTVAVACKPADKS